MLLHQKSFCIAFVFVNLNFSPSPILPVNKQPNKIPRKQNLSVSMTNPLTGVWTQAPKIEKVQVEKNYLAAARFSDFDI